MDADVVLHCDNQFIAYVSYDNGNNYNQIASGNHWPTAERFTVPNITPDTILDVDCADVGYIGAFIATVTIDGNDYYTDQPISNSNWQVVSSTDGVISPLVYNVKGASPWTITTADINNNANWVWNRNTWNTMKFRFDFGNLGN